MIRGIFIASIGYFTFGQAFTMVFAPLFAKQVLEIGDSGFGYMMAATGLGGVVGALVLAAVNPGRRRGPLTLAMLLVLGTLQVLFSASTYLDSVTVVFLVAPLMGAGQSGFMPVANAVIVEAAPERMRGRVVGLLSLDRAMAALGGAVAGFLAAAIGPQVAQIAFGLACVATAVAMFGLYPPIRRID